MSYTVTRVVAVDSLDEMELYAESWPVEDAPNVRLVLRHKDRTAATFDLQPSDARAFARAILEQVKAARRKP